MPASLGSITFKEPEGIVAHWITWLQPFDFKIVHWPGKHHSHADGLSRRTSRPCKRNTCLECAPLLHQVTGEEEGTVRAIIPQDHYVEHFDGYLELIEDDESHPWPLHPNCCAIWAVTLRGKMSQHKNPARHKAMPRPNRSLVKLD